MNGKATRTTRTTKLFGGRLFAMVDSKADVVNFAVKYDKDRAFYATNRNIISSVPLEGKRPTDQWLLDTGQKVLEGLKN